MNRLPISVYTLEMLGVRQPRPQTVDEQDARAHRGFTADQVRHIHMRRVRRVVHVQVGRVHYHGVQGPTPAAGRRLLCQRHAAKYPKTTIINN
jgi:hypothetical protein